MVLREFCESLKERHIIWRGEEGPIAESGFVSQHSNTRFCMRSWTPWGATSGSVKCSPEGLCFRFFSFC